jgi:hypothetical protein
MYSVERSEFFSSFTADIQLLTSGLPGVVFSGDSSALCSILIRAVEHFRAGTREKVTALPDSKTPNSLLLSPDGGHSPEPAGGFTAQ